MLVPTLNNEDSLREVPRLSSEPTNALDGLALGPATVLLRDEPPWTSAFPMAGRDAAWIPPMPKGEPGTTTKEASIVAMRIGDGRWSARDRCSVVVSALLGRRRSVLAVVSSSRIRPPPGPTALRAGGAAIMVEVDGIEEWK